MWSRLLLKVAIAQQVQDFAWGLQIELDNRVLFDVLGRGYRASVLLGFWPGRWSNEGFAGNIIDVGGVIAVIPAVTAGRKHRTKIF